MMDYLAMSPGMPALEARHSVTTLRSPMAPNTLAVQNELIRDLILAGKFS